MSTEQSPVGRTRTLRGAAGAQLCRPGKARLEKGPPKCAALGWGAAQGRELLRPLPGLGPTLYEGS